MQDQWVEGWLGVPRFGRYLHAVNGDRTRALALYEWNVTLGLALMRDISHFEIALRNAYDAAFTAHWQGSSHWLRDLTSPVVAPIWRTKKAADGTRHQNDVNATNRKTVEAAIRKLNYRRI